MTGQNQTIQTPILEVTDLSVSIPTPRGPIFPIRDVSFSLERGGLLAIVGESGSGKTLTGLSLLGLLPEASEKVGGSIRFGGKELLGSSEEEWNTLRGSRISMVFQEPQSALNPILTIGSMFREIFQSHPSGINSDQRESIIRELLSSVGLPRPDSISRSYPHQLSGGMRQRVLIAMAIALKPDIVIADEPTTALDVTISGQILSLLLERNRVDRMALILISHDLGIVRRTANRILVMYAGRIVETVSGQRFFSSGPSHPYSQALLLSRPSAGQKTKYDGPLEAIRGQVPPLWDLPPGCAFAPRCPKADNRCRTESPPWIETGPDEAAFCFYPGSGEDAA